MAQLINDQLDKHGPIDFDDFDPDHLDPDLPGPSVVNAAQDRAREYIAHDIDRLYCAEEPESAEICA